MKVNLVKKKTIKTYWDANAQSKSPFIKFLQKIKKADWDDLEDLKETFPKASVICKGERIIFRIGGSKYRMICSIRFGRKSIRLYVNFIGTHAEYDKLNKSGKICEATI